MPLTTLTANNAVTDTLVDGASYKAMLTDVAIEHNAPIDNETVYANEATGGESSVGTEILNITFSGMLKFGSSGAAPFVPLRAFQGVTFSHQYHTGIVTSGHCNFYSGAPVRSAGSPAGRFTARAQSTGPFTVTWA